MSHDWFAFANAYITTDLDDRHFCTLTFALSLSLSSCISPLRCCSDFRPYFTIHDSEFKEYTTRTQAPSVKARRPRWR